MEFRKLLLIMVSSAGKTILSVIVLTLLLFLAINIIGTRADIVEGVTGQKIRRIKPGMKLDQVISILGSAYKIAASRGRQHSSECKNPKDRLDVDITESIDDVKAVVDQFYNKTDFCCAGNREDILNKAVTLTYTRPLIFCAHYPMLWIHFDENYRVSCVFAKYYDGMFGPDDACIYSLSQGVDVNTLEGKEEEFINGDLFQKCFD